MPRLNLTLAPPESPLASSPPARKMVRGRVRPKKVRTKPLYVPAAFPWSAERRARVLSLEKLLFRGLNEISGSMQCKNCDARFELSYDLVSRFGSITGFIEKNKGRLNDRAPEQWLQPALPNCRSCGKSSAQPVLARKKRAMNWLFLVLGGFLGCCTLDQLKYFCKHTNNHRTGAKDRVLYLAYLHICYQLQPCNLFDPHHRG